MNGKTRCKILKDIRRQIAENNDISYVTSECKYQGDCKGTCPKCESEVRYLERELENRRKRGLAITLTGLATAVTLSTAGCDSPFTQVDGEMLPPESGIEESSTEERSTGETLRETEMGEFETLPEIMGIFALHYPAPQELIGMTDEEIERIFLNSTAELIRGEWEPYWGAAPSENMEFYRFTHEGKEYIVLFTFDEEGFMESVKLLLAPSLDLTPSFDAESETLGETEA